MGYKRLTINETENGYRLDGGFYNEDTKRWDDKDYVFHTLDETIDQLKKELA